jgi:pimeloyl-ACP methyl ester carboxylesterase
MRQVPSSGGVSLAVHDLGGEGPPLFLAHANGFHGRVFAPLATRLAGSFRSIAHDFRGHGESSPTAGGEYDWNGFGDDVLAVIDALALERPMNAVGHSLGGAALVLAELRRPGTFSSLYLYEPIIFERPEMTGANPMAERARKRRETFDSFDAAYDNYANKAPLDSLAPEALRAYVDHGFEPLPDGTVRLRCRGETEARIYEQSTTHAAYARVGEVTCPVTIAAGRDDGFGPATFAPLLVERLANGRLERFDDLGHFGPLEDPDRLATAILRTSGGSPTAT